MKEHFIPSGRVRYFPGSDYLPDPAGRYRFVSQLTGVTQQVSVRRNLVDTSYVEGSIPAVGPPPFEDKNADYLSAYRAALAFERARAVHPALAAWAKATRLTPLGAIGHYRDHPSVSETRERIKKFGLAAALNIGKLLIASD